MGSRVEGSRKVEKLMPCLLLPSSSSVRLYLQTLLQCHLLRERSLMAWPEGSVMSRVSVDPVGHAHAFSPVPGLIQYWVCSPASLPVFYLPCWSHLPPWLS